MAEVLLAFLTHATRHYHRDTGEPSSELRECKLVVKALRELYADLPAAEFGPRKMKAARQGWVNAGLAPDGAGAVARGRQAARQGWVNAGLARSECNRRTNLVRRIFKWAAAEELVPATVYHGLAVVVGLQKGRTPARETEPVGPVDDADVEANSRTSTGMSVGWSSSSV